MARTQPAAPGLAPAYDPAQFEGRVFQSWLAGGYFSERLWPEREPFCIVMPPPNVTGRLHMGHALDNTIQDILIRWRRMQGRGVLWQPGTDHAGIATQAVVEKRLAEEGTSRRELGRERFVERVWEWKSEYEKNILNQLWRLGASADWSRLRFTMDEGLSRAVEEVFVRYYERGLIYQGDRMVNWCPSCRTAISDLEVNHEERTGHIWTLRYPLAEGNGYIDVATTRPETMLGDTAVAVHPEDDRYRHLIGKRLRLPLSGRLVPIVADEAVEREFGTGAVKVTPAHDPNDYAIAERHQLPHVRVIDEDGRMTAEAGTAYQGLDRSEARQRVLADLKAAGALVGEREHVHAVGTCDRCDTVVEPLVSRQWWVRMEPLAKPAIEAVKSGHMTIVPERFTKVYLHWLENIHDWCISRQLWWGHRLPVWTCQDCDEVMVRRSQEAPTHCVRCGSFRVAQHEDVLDTWFSSALWPFSTLGWPEDTPELRYFYPTSVLVTGYDILFFWVVRMVFSGLAFTGEVPFRTVLLHGLVRDAEGRKMSKSLGNGVDPMDVIDRYGADALRFTLVTGNAPGNDMRFSWDKVESSRNFANKVWNAARFALMHLEAWRPGEDGPLTLVDRWILHRLAATTQEATALLERLEIGEAARVISDFIWDELCDWYIEAIKPRLYGRTGEAAGSAARATLYTVLESSLRLLHPYMPFITEEIWQHLPHAGESLMVQPWPEPQPNWRDEEAAQQMEQVMEIIRTIRALRAEMQVEPGRLIRAILVAGPERTALQAGAEYIKDLARVSALEISDRAPHGEKAVTAMARGVQVILPLKGLVDIDRELARLAKERAEAEAELERVRGKLGNEQFVAKAPASVVERERAREAEMLRKIARLQERADELGPGPMVH